MFSAFTRVPLHLIAHPSAACRLSVLAVLRNPSHHTGLSRRTHPLPLNGPLSERPHQCLHQPTAASTYVARRSFVFVLTDASRTQLAALLARRAYTKKDPERERTERPLAVLVTSPSKVRRCSASTHDIANLRSISANLATCMNAVHGAQSCVDHPVLARSRHLGLGISLTSTGGDLLTRIFENSVDGERAISTGQRSRMSVAGGTPSPPTASSLQPIEPPRSRTDWLIRLRSCTLV